MRAATAFFAGAGTVVVAIAAGLGGGLVLGDIMSPQQPKHQSSEVTRLEQRMSPQPIPATTGAAQPVPPAAPDQVAGTAAEPAPPPALPAQQPSQQAASPQVQPQAQPQTQQAATRPAEPKPQEQSVPAQAAAATAPPKSGNEQRAAPEDAFARARDADFRRDERRAEDKRKSERRKWSDKRKWRQRGDDDLREVEAAVREDSDRRVFGRNEAFFGRDDDRFERREQRPLFGAGPGSGRTFSLFDD